MEDKVKQEKTKSKFWKRLKTWICISASLLVVLLAALIILITSRFKDSNRSTYQIRNIACSELVKKNYIEGVQGTSESGKFSFVMLNEDINELLAHGVKTLNNKHIENIYYDVDSQGYRYFFVDLAKVGIKTRVVITTVPSVKDESTIKLSISSISIGKVNALKLLDRKGYLSSDFFDLYFAACHLPISFKKESLSFEVKPYQWLNMFPSSEIGNEIFNASKTIENAYAFNSNLFGFDLDISKYSSGKEYVNVDSSSVPNVYDEVKNGCQSYYPSMSTDETKVIYSLSEEDLNKHIKSSFVSTYKSEISSSLTSKKAVFDIVGANVHIDQLDKITVTLFFSINGYIVSKDAYLKLTASSEVFFGSYFTKESGSKLLDKALTNVLSCLSTSYSYFDYTSSEMFFINLESLNEDTDLSIDIRASKKGMEINHSSKTIEFKLTK